MFTKNRYHQIITILVAFTMIFSSTQPPVAYAQDGGDGSGRKVIVQTDSDGAKRQINSQTGRVSFIGPESGRALSAERALGTYARPQDPAMALANRYAPEFGVKNPARDLSQIKSIRSDDGRVTVHYQQKYNGIPVMGGELIVNTNDKGDLYSMNGEVSSELSLQTDPKIDSTQAVESALQVVAEQYDKKAVDFVTTEPELWIYDESLLKPSTRPIELVWRMEVTAKENNLPVRELVLVNAERGDISLHFNQVDNAWGEVGTTNEVQQDVQPVTVQPSEENMPLLAGVNWYVAPTGNDTNSCTAPASPCLTINGAIGKAGADDIIKVASGTYTGTAGSVVTISKSVTLSGGWNDTFTSQNGASVIDGGGVRSGVFVNDWVSYTVIDHFVIQDCTRGAANGGGIYAGNNTSVVLKYSSVINNSAAKGAGIYTAGINFSVSNSTISGNTASLSGGGMYAGNGYVGIRNSTIAYNNSNGSGGGLALNNSTTLTLSIRNVILAQNTASGGGPDCSGSNTISLPYSILGNAAGCTITSGTGAILNVDPKLDPSLSGSLPLHSLQAGSPAIDSGDNGNCPIDDQRGMSRPYGSSCDIGAYEYAPNGNLKVLNGSKQATMTGSPFALPLSVRVMDGSLNPAVGVTVTFMAPASGASGIFTDSGTNTTTAITDSNGDAVSSAFTANSQWGVYSVNATVSGVPGTAVFQLTNNGIFYVAATGSNNNSCSTALLPCATVNGAIGKAMGGDQIRVATGTYTGTGTEVVLINKNVSISGGWNASFAAQTGMSIFDGQSARRGVTLNSGVTANIERSKVQNSYYVGIFNDGGALTLNSSIVSGTKDASGSGFGIRNQSGSTLTLNTSIISDNSGHGIYNTGSSILLTLNSSTINNNVETGISNQSGALTLNNSTISGNLRGGLSNSGGTATLNNSTVTGNTSTSWGGIYTSGGTITVKNTIVAGNSAATSGSDCYGSINSAGYNLIGDTAGCTFVASTGDLTNVNPKLGELIGAPGYHSLQADSPAIDAGNPSTCLSVDERGISRPQGSKCDIGAYEYTVPGSVASLSIIGGNNQHALPGVAFSKPLKVVALDSLGSPVSSINITFTAPNNGASGTFSNTNARTTTVTTDVNGIATTSIFTANAIVGSYQVVASANGIESANFTLSNVLWYVAPTGNDSNDCHAPVTPCATINGVLAKPDFFDGDRVLVAAGTYTGNGPWIVLLDKDVDLSGGWDATFTTQDGWSVIDGQNKWVGIRVNESQSTIEQFIIQHGSAGASAGGISNNSGKLILNNVIVQNNTGEYGAGIDNRGVLTLNNSLVINNYSPQYGGGVYNGATLTVNNSTISGNEAQYGGGFMMSGSTIVLNNSTITANRANQGLGGGIYYNGDGYSGTITVQNTLVAGNSSGSGGPDCSGPIISAGYNLIGNSSGCTFTPTTGDLVGTSAKSIDPRLTPVQDNGGLTLTHALMGGSPAINAGNSSTCLTTDQRGVARPQGSVCDIGAVEYQPGSIPSLISVLQGSPQFIMVGEVAGSNLAVVVTDGTGAGVPGVTVTFTAPLSGPSGVFSNTGTNETTVVTGFDGVATTSSFTANAVYGAYKVQATAIGMVDTTDFNLANGSKHIETYIANNTSSLPGTFLCDQTQPNCTNGSNPHGDGAHKYAIGSHTFYAANFNRDSIDNNGMTIISTVQYCEPGFACPFGNAYWYGTQMVYGSAYGFALADDIVAHELTHGVTERESNLFYYYQSGAINESLSDVFGEYYDQTNGQGTDTAGVKWQIGEDVTGLGAFRSMSNPPAFGDPDKMSSANYYISDGDGGGVHTNSGVNNKAVYLMVDGGSFNGKTVTALGWEKVGAIYYEAQTNLLTSASDYSDLYLVLQQACSNLIGQHEITTGNCTQVKTALDAVEMNKRQSFGDLQDPSFEYSYATYPYWAQYSTNYGSPLCTIADCGDSAGTAGPRTGSVWGWLGGTTNNEAASLTQVVYFPDGYPSLKLKFYLWIGRASSGSDANDKFTVLIDNVPVFSANATQKNSYSSYKQVSVDVSGFATNALHTIKFYTETSGQVVNFNLDDVSLVENTRSISGNAGTGDVVLQYADGGFKTVTADGSGNYTIYVSPGWSGTVTPSKAGYIFSPLNRSYSNVTTNQTTQNYTATLLPTISGNAGAPGVTLSYVDGTAKTVVSQGDGSYTITVPSGWSGTVTPSKAGYFFSPLNRSYSNVTTNQTAQNYIATFMYTISGNVGVGGVTLSYTDGGAKTVTLQRRRELHDHSARWLEWNSNPNKHLSHLCAAEPQLQQPGSQHKWAELHQHIQHLNRLFEHQCNDRWEHTGNYGIGTGQRLTDRYGINGGPVRVRSTNRVNMFTSQRAIYGSSFNSIVRFPADQRTTEYWFTSLDDAGMITYLVIGNPSETETALVDVYIGGVKKNTTPYSIPPGQRVYPRYGINGGPVRVVSTNGVSVF
ncbi:MAG: M4 family metallopeptidase [Anaerolineales bacterium]|nr:M4 family metallopeptidase [Anaerolineales bacterium]